MSQYEEELAKHLAMEEQMDELTFSLDRTEEGNFMPLDEDEEYTRLLSDNAKFKLRLAVLRRAIEAESKKPPVVVEERPPQPEDMVRITDEMVSIHEFLTEYYDKAIKKAFPQYSHLKAIIAPVANKISKFGDYQCNSPISIAKFLKTEGVSMSPRDVGLLIQDHAGAITILKKAEVATPGFINIFLREGYLVNAVKRMVAEGLKPPQVERKRVVIDFSSPNIAKEMHVGHLRSTIIGESTCRLLEYLGHDVVRVNHVGDWGTQFGMLIAHLEDRFPTYLTQSPPIADLQAFYKESKKRFDEEEEFKKRAYQRVVALQSGEPNSKKAWQMICDVSRREFDLIYSRLDVKIYEKGESFYQSRMVEIVKYLESKNLLEMDEGRKIMWVDEAKTGIPLTIVKTDGGYTYDTSDMAAIRYRIEEEKGDWLIYVVDAGQHTHLNNIFLAATRCGILDPSKHRVDHVDFGVVLGEDNKKFKTRSGDTVKLSDLLDEGLKRSMDKLKEKERHKVLSPIELAAANEAVAYGCIKYADLSHNRTSNYVFSFDKMLEDRGNTAVYLLYAYTRICSIVSACTEEIGDWRAVLERPLENINLTRPEELRLMKTILRFYEVLHKVSNSLMLHFLCEYCYDLCTTFSEFYDRCYCLERIGGQVVKVHKERIMLCEATAIILRQCFHILGLKPLNKI